MKKDIDGIFIEDDKKAGMKVIQWMELFVGLLAIFTLFRMEDWNQRFYLIGLIVVLVGYGLIVGAYSDKSDSDWC